MSASPVYIAIAIVVLAVIAGLVYFAGRRKEKRLTPLAGLAFAFVPRESYSARSVGSAMGCWGWASSWR